MALATARLVEQIGHRLHGNPREVQGAVLADLLAMWLAGHVVLRDDEPKWVTDQLMVEMREELLTEHIKVVRDLVKPNQEMILERVRKGSS
jgi:hypothetical protein